jgi:hypothetical protein
MYHCMNFFRTQKRDDNSVKMNARVMGVGLMFHNYHTKKTNVEYVSTKEFQCFNQYKFKHKRVIHINVNFNVEILYLHYLNLKVACEFS